MAELTSIVVTTYNHALFVEECMDSIISQNFPDLEIVVVDDGSNDDTVLRLSKFEKYGVNIFVKKNGGPSSSLNFGLNKANGDNIVILSGDDKLLRDSIKHRIEILSHPNIDFVSSSPIIINEKSTVIPSDFYSQVFRHPGKISPLLMFKKLYYDGNFICAPSISFKRRCWEKLGLFNDILWQLQDYEYWLRATTYGFRFAYIDFPVIAYRIHGNNLSTANNARVEAELDHVILKTSLGLSNDQLAQLLFGHQLNTLTTEIKRKTLLALLKARHKRPNIKKIGQMELYDELQELNAADLPAMIS